MKLPTKDLFAQHKILIYAVVSLLAVLVLVFVWRATVVTPSLSLSDAASIAKPVHRFWSEQFQHHFYTLSETERDFVILNDKNWRYEGTVYDAFDQAYENTIPIYRFWSEKYRGHFYSKSPTEVEYIKNNDPNWRYEGIAFYVLEEGPDARPVFRFYIPAKNAHFYTPLESERDKLLAEKKDWQYEGVAFYTAKVLTETVQPTPDPKPSPGTPAINGACGASHGEELEEEPLNQFCVSGEASDVSGDGPWTWKCLGVDGGSDTQCEAQKTSNPVTECSDGVDNDGDGFVDEDDFDCANANDDNESGTDQTPVNATCGANHSQTLIARPETGLCASGNATVVSGTGPWTWNCIGIFDGDDDSCSSDVAITTVGGQCGTSNNQTLDTTPTSGLCTTGTSSQVAGNGPWVWICSGANGGTDDTCNASLTPVPTNGACGASNTQTLDTEPTSGLCVAGSATDVTGEGPWDWNCTGSNGGTDDSCTANLTPSAVNGQCGASNTGTFDTTPTTGLCTTGTATQVAGEGPWVWVCTGANGGTNDSCSANLTPAAVNGACGASNNQTLDTTPTSGLCVAGSATDVTGEGPWDWNCTGANGGTSDSCNANKTPDPIIGACGTSNGNVLTTAPTSNLCSTGTASQVTGNGPWVWICSGEHGGGDDSCSADVALEPLNGACGASNNQTLDTEPTTNLCTVGSASEISGTGPWNWNCTGANSGSDDSCTANLTPEAVNGTCGTSNNQTLDTTPTSGLCTTGTSSQVAGNGPWVWICSGANGGTDDTCNASLTPVPTNGACGASNTQTLDTEPTSGLCVAGSATDVTGEGPWDWNCTGSNGGTDDSCTANLTPSAVNGQCGASNTGTFDTTPTTGLCTTGTATQVAGEGPWVWVCTGANGGTNDSCSANLTPAAVNGACGASNNQTLDTTPTSGLCVAGSATDVTGEGPWDWNCTGANGGTSDSCNANKTPDPIIGACGTSNGNVLTTAPTSNLCSTGTASQVTGNGPWVWICSGEHGGGDDSCSADVVIPVVDGLCGSSDNQTLSSAPTSGLCTQGTPSTLSGTGPWDWSCIGANGGTTDSCNADIVPTPVSGTCGTSHDDPTSVEPVSGLCSSGTPSSVTGTGPWNWSCAGSDGGTDDSCSAPKINPPVNGSCGASHGDSLDEAPTTNLCTDGTSTLVTGEGPWAWQCTGTDGGSDAICSAQINAVGFCGLDHGQTLDAPPSNPLCVNGTTPADETGGGPWNWTCRDNGGVIAATCQALSSTVDPVVTGQCGLSKDTCTEGTFIDQADNSTQWLWGCVGSGGGDFAQCALDINTPSVTECNDGIDNDGDTFIDLDDFDCANANDNTESGTNQSPVNGLCSGLSGQSLDTDPSPAALCDAGSPSTTSIVGDEYRWSCLGENAGTNDDCTATWLPNVTPVDGACSPGLAPQYEVLPALSELCATGEASILSSSDPDYHEWYCAGTGGGSSVQCSALQGYVIPICNDGIDNDGDGDIDSNDLGCSDAFDMIEADGPYADGGCGTAHNSQTSSEPSANLCDAGPASALSGDGPWGWTCGDGRNGGAVVSCTTLDPPTVLCGPSDGDTFPYTQTFTRPSEPCYPPNTAQWQTSSGDANPQWTCVDGNGFSSGQCSATVLPAPTPECADGLDNDGDTYIDLDDFDCNSAADTSESGSTNQICGIDHGATLDAAPTNPLCLNGMTSAQETGSGPWQWVCLDSSSAITAICQAEVTGGSPAVIGQCGQNNGTCTTGTFIEQDDTDTQYLWGCVGSGDFNTFAQCTLDKGSSTPQCADGLDNDNDTFIDLNDFDCSDATDVTESGGTPNTYCGIDHGATLSVPPANPLCVGGTTVSDQTGNGPWQWACRNSNGDVVETCSANASGATQQVVGACGVEINTCTDGAFIDAEDSATQAFWGCLGSGGFSTFAECSTSL